MSGIPLSLTLLTIATGCLDATGVTRKEANASFYPNFVKTGKFLWNKDIVSKTKQTKQKQGSKMEIIRMFATKKGTVHVTIQNRGKDEVVAQLKEWGIEPTNNSQVVLYEKEKYLATNDNWLERLVKGENIVFERPEYQQIK